MDFGELEGVSHCTLMAWRPIAKGILSLIPSPLFHSTDGVLESTNTYQFGTKGTDSSSRLFSIAHNATEKGIFKLVRQKNVSVD
jgi:hypothetical protein